MFIMIRNLPKLFTGFTNYILKVCDDYAVGLVYGYSEEELSNKLFKDACNSNLYIKNPIIYWWGVMLYLKRKGVDISKIRRYKGNTPIVDMILP